MKIAVQLLKTFVITLIVAFTATSNQNLIYNILDKLGYENDVLKKTVLSAVITLLIGLLSILISYLWSAITSIIKKMDVTLITIINGRKKETIKFTPSNYEYDSQDVEIEITLQPKGQLSNLLIKKLGVTLDVYFNPELIDVSYSDRWDCEANQVFNIYERKISVDLLGKIDIKGRTFSGKSHKLNERFKVKPIRVKSAETYLDYVIVSTKFGKLGKTLSGYLLSVKYEPLKVNCEGDVD
ncbi:hypothetical protein [Lysinibacillus sphaericus]|uniref:DNA-binding protein n=1 Tax=Lysinibacillus sphaericus OT4b.31 TaxID=1285586 RepID=R7ZJG0_LYSSH|nr:hypothetical protein [Lysinibacillus sphaericus]EON74267.1 DNA-binding protein [Lysinibacillus sphaericus OT4b.31]